MIGQAGTGSPEAGIVLQRRSPCSCLHLADGGTRQDTQGPRADSGVQSAADARNLDSIYHPRGSYYTLAQKNKFVFAGNRTLSCNFSSPFRAEMRQTF